MLCRYGNIRVQSMVLSPLSQADILLDIKGDDDPLFLHRENQTLSRLTLHRIKARELRRQNNADYLRA